jgi:hypothetical protein
LSKLDPKTGIISRVPGIEARNYHQEIHTLIDSLHQREKSLAAILKVPDFADEKKEFSISNQTDVLIVAVGEGLLEWELVDYGWLENARGDTVWDMNPMRRTFHLSGAIKNRIQAGVVTLAPGDYVLRYKSDDSHAYGKWNEPQTADSAWWGIQVLPINQKQAALINHLIEMDLAQPCLEGLEIYALCYSRTGNLWIGSDLGLSSFNPKSKKIINYLHNPADPSSLSDNRVDDILEDRDGILWIATRRGLNRLDPQLASFQIYHEKEGLPSGQIRAIAEDKDGNLWISSINGITKFEKNLKTDKPLFINYDVQDGLQGYEFFQGSQWKSKNGELVFGGRNGFNAFFPGIINHKLPQVVLSNFKFFNIKPGDSAR